MPGNVLPTWSNLRKSATDATTIEQAIISYINQHLADVRAHFNQGQSGYLHSSNPNIDHPNNSIGPLKDSYTSGSYDYAFADASLWSVFGSDTSLVPYSYCQLVVRAGETGSSINRQLSDIIYIPSIFSFKFSFYIYSFSYTNNLDSFFDLAFDFFSITFQNSLTTLSIRRTGLPSLSFSLPSDLFIRNDPYYIDVTFDKNTNIFSVLLNGVVVFSTDLTGFSILFNYSGEITFSISEPTTRVFEIYVSHVALFVV